VERPQFEVIAVIASRKTELYLRVKDKLLELLPKSVNQEEGLRRLRHAISSLDNLLFVGDQERESQTIMPGLPILQLKLNQQEITRRIIDALTTG